MEGAPAIATETAPSRELPGEPATAPAGAPEMPPMRLDGARGPTRVAVAVLIVGLLVTAALAVTSRLVYDHNENRLLVARMRELALVLTGAVPQIQTPLASGEAFADATGGDVAKFRTFMASSVGPGRQFIAAALLADRHCPSEGDGGARQHAPVASPTRARLDALIARTAVALGSA